jgi:hypothetical protein
VKNQYFGDINDYKKYSLLRLLSGQGQIKTKICWILTEDDGRNDGSRIKYLEKPEQWGNFDPVVFEHLRENVLKKGIRNVATIEQGDILHNCSFYSDLVFDDNDSRLSYFQKFIRSAKGTDLVFFDPDNGLEIKSIPRGKRGSSKYIYWDEVKASYEAGHSLLIYQHFPRKPRELFLRNLVRKFKDLIGTHLVFSYCTYHVTFLLVPQPKHYDLFVQNSKKVEETWGEVIKVGKHRLARSVV